MNAVSVYARIRQMLQRFAADENGSMSVEYILLAGGVSVMAVATLEPLREIVRDKWEAISVAVASVH